MSAVRRRRSSSKSEECEKSVQSSDWSLSEDKENMMGRDRTGEFQSALRSLQGRAQTRQGHPGPNFASQNRANRSLGQYSEFIIIAK